MLPSLSHHQPVLCWIPDSHLLPMQYGHRGIQHASNSTLPAPSPFLRQRLGFHSRRFSAQMASNHNTNSFCFTYIQYPSADPLQFIQNFSAPPPLPLDPPVTVPSPRRSPGFYFLSCPVSSVRKEESP